MARYVVLSMLCLALGCGSANHSPLPAGDTGTVKGKITFMGAAVPEGCSVTFIKDDTGLVAVGTTNAAGEFVLRMRGGLDVLVGNYRVAISPPSAVLGMSDHEINMAAAAGKLPNTAAIREVPEKYRSLETTTEIASVKAGANEYTLDMKE